MYTSPPTANPHSKSPQAPERQENVARTHPRNPGSTHVRRKAQIQSHAHTPNPHLGSTIPKP